MKKVLESEIDTRHSKNAFESKMRQKKQLMVLRPMPFFSAATPDGVDE